MQIPYFDLRIHVWGGLGSQLYAWALLEDLRIRFPERQITLVMHNSGVTKRDEELSDFFESDEISVIGDYRNAPRHANRIVSRARNRTQALIKQLLIALGFIATADTDLECSMLRPWVVSLRGHYTKRLISGNSISKILSSLESSRLPSGTHLGDSILGLHFRLGDLLALDSKSPLSISRVTHGLKLGIQSGKFSSCWVFSDSPIEAEVMLRESFPDVEFMFSQANAQNTILELLCVDTFVGTPSKISEWVALIRIHKSSTPNVFLPWEMKGQMETTLSTGSKIVFY
jgi:hypothetical protein